MPNVARRQRKAGRQRTDAIDEKFLFLLVESCQEV